MFCNLVIVTRHPMLLSAGTFVYAGLLLTEGTGLLMRKRRAEYFTIITEAVRDSKALHRCQSPGVGCERRNRRQLGCACSPQAKL
jgi:Predicted membrane protein (DUF2127)